MSFSSGTGTVFVNVHRACASLLPATPAAALESMTEDGISFGASNVPHAYIPGLDVWTGLKLDVAAKL